MGTVELVVFSCSFLREVSLPLPALNKISHYCNARSRVEKESQLPAPGPPVMTAPTSLALGIYFKLDCF